MFNRKATPTILIAIALTVAALALSACYTGAPAATPVDTAASFDPAAEVVGIYKTILPAASSPGIDGTLYLSDGGSLRQVLDYLNEDEPLVEVGTWTVAPDGIVTLTVTGQEGQAWDVPSVSTFQAGEHTLTAMPNQDALGAILAVWYKFGSLATGQVEMPYDAAIAAQRMANTLADTYRAFQPSGSCCGQDISLSLHTDGIALLKTDYLNGEPAIEEVGAWESTGPTSLRVTINGRQDRVYQTPEVTEYVVEDGALRSETGLVLRSIFGYAMHVIAQASGESASIVDVTPGSLTEQSLSEAELDLPDLGPLQLRAGRYEHKYGSGATEVDTVLLQSSAFGDLDGDGVSDGAAVVAVQRGGSGSYYYLAALLDRDGIPQQAGAVLLGDRVQVQSVTIEEGLIEVKMKTHAAGDPMCCPTVEVTRSYRLSDGTLAAVEQ